MRAHQKSWVSLLILLRGESLKTIMIERKVTLAEILLIAGTRVALGVGIGLLLSSKLTRDHRKAAGVALTLVGGLTTVPLAMNLIGQKGTTTPRSEHLRRSERRNDGNAEQTRRRFKQNQTLEVTGRKSYHLKNRLAWSSLSSNGVQE